MRYALIRSSQRDADDRGNAAAVQRIRLDDNHGPPEPGTGACRRGQIRPPDLALRDYHSLLSRARREAGETNSSFASPISAQALFIASVTLSGA